MNMKPLHFFVIIFALTVFAVLMGVIITVLLLDRPVDLNQVHTLDKQGRFLLSIEKGSNLKQVNLKLSQNEIIGYPLALTGWAILLGKQGIQAGDYWVEAGDTSLSLLDKFIQGDVAQHSITFPEGWSFNQWIEHISQISQFSFLLNMDQDTLLALVSKDITYPEGWFFPDTYQYSKNDNIFDILKQAHLRMCTELNLAWQNRDDNLPYLNPYEALIMASIVEKETGQAAERKAIAGVFVRRLKQGMRLQTDPTVIYGMGDRYKGDIRRQDLRAFTPYNTYRIEGLPPTPIAMPGLASIKAALHPLSGSSLYFVARGDGSHQFSDTMKQHLEAVRKFQIEQRVQDYRSAPK